MASSLNKRKYTDEEAKDPTATPKKQWPFDDDDGNDSDYVATITMRRSLLRRDPPSRGSLL
jgi:hypothetical protein